MCLGQPFPPQCRCLVIVMSCPSLLGFYVCTGAGNNTSHRMPEYEVKKLHSPACSRLQNAIFSPHIHGIDGKRPQYRGWQKGNSQVERKWGDEAAFFAPSAERKMQMFHQAKVLRVLVGSHLNWGIFLWSPREKTETKGARYFSQEIQILSIQ